MRIVFYSASTSAHSNSSTKTTYQRSGQIPGMKWTGFIRTANLL